MRYRILIIDDEPHNLDALTRVLRADYDVLPAASAEAALAILEAEGQQIDLILADHALPGRSGVELLELAKELSPAVRIVITALADASELTSAINRGEVYRHIPKPWSAEELRQTVVRALEHYQLARDNAELIAELKRKNSELKAMATRVADAFLRRLDDSGPLPGVASGGQSFVRDILGAAAYPTVKLAAKTIVNALTRAREHLREGRGAADLDYLDVVTRDCLVEARRILSIADEVEEIAK